MACTIGVRQYADSEQAKSKKMSYAESDSEGLDDDNDIFKPALKAKNARPAKRRKVSESAEEDTYEVDVGAEDGRSAVSWLQDIC
jgi:hypothetical protein